MHSVGCVPPAAVAVRGGGGSTPGTLLGPEPPEPATPLGSDPPPGPGTPRDQATPCGQTHTCKHITLPQTSFVAGNNVSELKFVGHNVHQFN